MQASNRIVLQACKKMLKQAREEEKKANVHRMKKHKRAVLNQVDALKNKVRAIALKIQHARASKECHGRSKWDAALDKALHARGR